MSLESLARSLRGNLTYDADAERDWDRLTALAMGSVTADHRTARESLLNSLGVSLIALKHARRFDLLRMTADGLADCLAWRFKSVRRQDRRRVARLAIAEWTDDSCKLCTGAGHVYDRVGVQRPCPSCGGSRKHRYSDEERAQALEVRDGSKWAWHVEIAHAQIQFAIDLAYRQAKEKLGR